MTARCAAFDRPQEGVKLDGPIRRSKDTARTESGRAVLPPARLSWLERCGVWASANVRGGVYGQEWYKAGYKTSKSNTWRDFIACAEYLVAQKYTTSARLGILGGSAGGILVGRALTERPDLFAAVIPAVGVLDAVRAEATANGVPNIPEFGTVTKEDEFRGLLAMSSYHHVKPGTRYPAVMLTHGVNDPRVDVWHRPRWPRACSSQHFRKPILLTWTSTAARHRRYQAQRQKQIADNYAFLFWHVGHPDFQPRRTRRKGRLGPPRRLREFAVFAFRSVRQKLFAAGLLAASSHSSSPARASSFTTCASSRNQLHGPAIQAELLTRVRGGPPIR